MYRLFAVAGAFALAVAFSAALAEAKKEDKAKSIHDIMETAHGEDGLKDQVSAANKAKKLADAKKPAEEWAKLAGELGKNKPPLGADESWKKLTTAYEKQVKALAAAVKDDKPENVAKALKAINSGCATCHKAHRKPKD